MVAWCIAGRGIVTEDKRAMYGNRDAARLPLPTLLTLQTLCPRGVCCMPEVLRCAFEHPVETQALVRRGPPSCASSLLHHHPPYPSSMNPVCASKWCECNV